MKTLFAFAIFFLALQAGAATAFDVAIPAHTVTGDSFNFTISAMTGSSVDTAYTGTVHVASTDPAATPFPFDYTFTPADAGTHTFGGTFATSGSGFDAANQSVTVRDAANSSITGAGVSTVKWNPSIVRGFTFEHPDPVNRTEPFPLTVYARNADMNVVPGFTGTIHFRYTSGITGLPDYAYTPADAGVHTFSPTANEGQHQVITAERVDDASTGYSTSFYVNCPEFTVTAGNTGPMCPNGDPSVYLYAVPSQDNATRYDWTGPHGWFNPLGEPNPHPPAPGTYFIDVTNTNRCRASAFTVVETKPAPQPQLTPSTSHLCGGTATVTLNDPGAYSNIVWSTFNGQVVGGQGTPTVEVAPAITSGPLDVFIDATYTSSGCTSHAVTEISIDPGVAANISTPAAACPGIAANASTADQGPGAHYTWSVTHGQILLGQGTSSIQYAPSGDGDVTVSLDVTKSGSTCVASDAETVTVSGPRAILDSHDLACPGGEVTIPVTLQGTPPFNITWSDGVTQSNINANTTSRTVIVSGSQTYTIATVSDAQCGGSAAGEAVIEEEERPSITRSPEATRIETGGRATLTVDASGTAIRYDWYEGHTGERTHLVASGASSSYTTPPLTQSTSYWVEAIDACGSAQSATAPVIVGGRRRPGRH